MLELHGGEWSASPSGPFILGKRAQWMGGGWPLWAGDTADLDVTRVSLLDSPARIPVGIAGRYSSEACLL
jgi:hypothetical protein